MTNTFLRDLIPESNRIEVAFASRPAATELLQSLYDAGSGFVGVFIDADDQPTWARRAARYLRDEFRHDTPGKVKAFGDVSRMLADGGGQCLPNFRHALDAWFARRRQGVEPYTLQQDRGSCVDASGGEGETGLVGWRAAHPAILTSRGNVVEQYLHPCGWYQYGNRGYCSDGWNGYGRATVARKVGIAFRVKYAIGDNSIDFTDDDQNEQIVARTWCRSGIPAWLAGHTAANHGYEDGAITEFQESGGKAEMLKLFAAGGFLHTSGTRTSGGAKPFTIGSVGPHMQTAAGCDDSDNFRTFCRGVLDVPPRADDFPVIIHQTWGAGWRGECADKYWPFGTDASGKVWTMADVKAAQEAAAFTDQTLAELNAGWGWGWKPQGAWVWWASDVLSRLSCDIAYLPRVKGFPSTEPSPAPPPSTRAPEILGALRAEPLPAGIAIRGELSLTHAGTTWRYIAVPAGDRSYRLEEKPRL